MPRELWLVNETTLLARGRRAQHAEHHWRCPLILEVEERDAAEPVELDTIDESAA